ncbi:MAG: ATP-binding protein [Candidatus Sulfotelmatobacter sp.]
MDERHKSEILLAIREKAKEHRRLEFKQRVELNTPGGKAEFIRDVLALANSEGETPRDCGALVVGVKNGEIWDVAADNNDGATLRDIVRANIAPDLQIDYDELRVGEGKRIGVLEITADPNELYVVKRDLTAGDGKKLLVAGQSWGRVGDQKTRLTGDEIVSRIQRIRSSAATVALIPLRQRLNDLEETLRRSGPAAEVRRVGYAIELETDWRRIPEQIAKLLPYARDFGIEVGFEIARILRHLAGRISPATPVSAIRSFTGVFRAIVPFTSDETFARRAARLDDTELRLVELVVDIESSICEDGAVRLRNAVVVDVCSTITQECLRFAHVNREASLEARILRVLDSLITRCTKSTLPEIQNCAKRLEYIRNDGLLDPEDRERLMLQAMESRRKTMEP